MTAPFWAKLWIDILDDPKVAAMPDWLFRKFIIFVLAAKEYDHDGLLQPVKDVAWRIRCSAQEATDALSALSSIGVARETAEGWILVNFVKRQQREYSDSPEAIRKRIQRDKKAGHVPRDISSSVSYSSSDSLTSLNDKTIFSIRDAERAYIQVTQFSSAPMSVMPYLENILDLLQHYGWDETITRLKAAKENWVSHKNKSTGANYKITNPAWIDYAITGEMPGAPAQLTRAEREQKELEALLERDANR